LKSLYLKLLYPLEMDSYSDAKYFGHAEDLLLERNFGRVKMEHFGERKYRFYFTVEGNTTSLQKALEVDLNEDIPTYHDLFGRIEKTSGKLSYLRIHDVDSGYGGNVSNTQDEVIIKLDNAEEKFYSFPLEKNQNAYVNKGMLNRLQAAFIENELITIEYKRESIAGGKIIRLH
jgi:hypothetical protein